MQVFKACGAVIRRHAASLLIYLVVFVGLAVMLSAIMAQQESEGPFRGVKPSVAVVNRDGDTALVRGLIAFLGENTELVPLADEKEILQDALFFHDVSYILILPAGFSADFAAGGDMKADMSMVPNQAEGRLADNLVSQYLRTARMYGAALPDMDGGAVAKAAAADLARTAEAEKVRFGESAPLDRGFTVYYQMMAYILVALLILGTGSVLVTFNRPDLRMRNLCAPVPLRSVNAQLALGIGTMSLVFWAALVLLGFLMYGSRLGGADPRSILLLLANSLFYLLVSVGIGFLLGSLIQSFSAQNAAANFLGLGLSFLGGAFVPLELLGSGVIAAAHFTPGYWYVAANDTIASLTRFDRETLTPVFTAMGVQLLFAAALFAVTLLVTKVRRQSSKGFGQVKTEMDA